MTRTIRKNKGSHSAAAKPAAAGRSVGTWGLRPLAEKLGVSVGTVSNAFNRPSEISCATRQRVLEAAREVGYVPNHHASMLRRRKSRQIGLLVSQMDNPFYVAQAQQAQDTAAARGYDVVLGSSGYWDIKQEIAAVRHFTSLRVAGVILITRPSTEHTEHLQSLLQCGCKIVSRRHPQEAMDGMSVLYIDIEAGACEAATYLIGLGHRRLAVMTYVGKGEDMQTILTQDPKVRGVHQAVLQAGLTNDAMDVICFERERLASAQQAFEDCLRQPAGRRPTALIANNDAFALAAYSAARRLGLSVPEDVSVMGYDNIEASMFYSPPLTTVSQMHLNPGHRAMNMLLDQIEQPDQEPSQLQLQPKLIVRQSTAPPPLAGRASSSSKSIESLSRPVAGLDNVSLT